MFKSNYFGCDFFKNSYFRYIVFLGYIYAVNNCSYIEVVNNYASNYCVYKVNYCYILNNNSYNYSRVTNNNYYYNSISDNYNYKLDVINNYSYSLDNNSYKYQSLKSVYNIGYALDAYFYKGLFLENNFIS